MSTTETAKEKLAKGAKAASAAAQETAQQAAEAAKAQVTAKTTEARDGLASEMHTTAAALRRAADEVRAGSPQGSTFSYLADGLADMADSVKDQNVNDMIGAVTGFARNNPVAFLGGAALLGFAASRYAKASTPPAAPRIAPPSPTYNASAPTHTTEYSND